MIIYPLLVQEDLLELADRESSLSKTLMQTSTEKVLKSPESEIKKDC